MASHPESVPDAVAAVFARAETFLDGTENRCGRCRSGRGFIGDSAWACAHDLARFAQSEHAALVRERDAAREQITEMAERRERTVAYFTARTLAAEGEADDLRKERAARDRLLAQQTAVVEAARRVVGHDTTKRPLPWPNHWDQLIAALAAFDALAGREGTP